MKFSHCVYSVPNVISPFRFVEKWKNFQPNFDFTKNSAVCLQFSGITTTTTPTPPQIEQETRVPKVLNGWFENPYVIKQKPNFEAVIEASRNSAIQNMTKKLEPNVSIATEPDAFFSGKNQCGQL